MANYSISEKYILDLFSNGSSFLFKGNQYEVQLSGKPKSHGRGGEPKTDIYVQCIDNVNGEKLELKISFKQDNADFLENKMSAERAEQIFGYDWKFKVERITKEIESEFINRPYIFKEKLGRTSKGSITLGWKFELLNKSGGELSNSITLNPEEVLEVYSGRNLNCEKRNAKINGNLIIDSGVANFVLVSNINDISSIQEAVDNLIDIEEYAVKHPEVYFACKALNYRSFAQKYDGDRPLSVFVEWNVENSKLNPVLRFDQPLTTKGNQVCCKLIESLNLLGISNTDEINEHNVLSTRFVNF